MERRNWRMRFHMVAQQAWKNERVATGGGMRVIPAIDLKDGRCVRLRQGDMAAETVYSEDVPSVAGRWQQQGADQGFEQPGKRHGDDPSPCDALTLASPSSWAKFFEKRPFFGPTAPRRKYPWGIAFLRPASVWHIPAPATSCRCRRN